MAETKKSWQDYFTASFGEQGEAKGGVNALEVGGRDSGGVFEPVPIGTSSAGTAVLVDLIGAEAVTVNVGTFGIAGYTGTAGTATQTRLVATSAGALNVSGSITGVGIVGNVNAGSIIVTNGTVVGGMGTYQGTWNIAVGAGSGTVTPAITGLSRTFVVATPQMEGTGTATLRIIDGLGGTLFEKAQVENGTTIYGSVVPLTSEQEWRVTCDATQSATIAVLAKVYYDK